MQWTQRIAMQENVDAKYYISSFISHRNICRMSCSSTIVAKCMDTFGACYNSSLVPRLHLPSDKKEQESLVHLGTWLSSQWSVGINAFYNILQTQSRHHAKLRKYCGNLGRYKATPCPVSSRMLRNCSKQPMSDRRHYNSLKTPSVRSHSTTTGCLGWFHSILELRGYSLAWYLPWLPQ